MGRGERVRRRSRCRASERLRGLARTRSRRELRFTLKVKGARNSFSHYSELLGHEAADHELLRAALAAHAEERTRGRIRDQVPPLTGFRALFADDVAIELTFPGGEDEELGKLIEGISVHIGHFLLFVRAAFGAYIATLPPEIFEDWLEED
jgi:hypothetical protein